MEGKPQPVSSLEKPGLARSSVRVDTLASAARTSCVGPLWLPPPWQTLSLKLHGI